MAKNRYSITLVSTVSDEEIAEALHMPIEEITAEIVRDFGETHVKEALVVEAEKRIQNGKLSVMREI